MDESLKKEILDIRMLIASLQREHLEYAQAQNQTNQLLEEILLGIEALLEKIEKMFSGEVEANEDIKMIVDRLIALEETQEQHSKFLINLQQ